MRWGQKFARLLYKPSLKFTRTFFKVFALPAAKLVSFDRRKAEPLKGSCCFLEMQKCCCLGNARSFCTSGPNLRTHAVSASANSIIVTERRHHYGVESHLPVGVLLLQLLRVSLFIVP